jgi:hypothetical protein
MATSFTLQNDPALPQGYLKVDGSTSATFTTSGITGSSLTDSSVTASKLGTNEQKQIAKAWVNFNGTGTVGGSQAIRSSYNISSVTRNADESYTIAFSTPMTDSNYVIVGTSNGTNLDGNNVYNTTLFDNTSRTTSSFKIRNTEANLTTSVLVQCVVVFGN